MLNKIYLIAFAVFLLVMSALISYSCSWLKSITNPKDVIEYYEYYSTLSWYFLWISSSILLVLANVILWKLRKYWAFWTTLLYCVIFIVLKTFWLDRSFYEIKNQEGFSYSPFLGVVLCLGVATFVLLNQLLMARIISKMFPPEQPIETSNEDETVKENES